MNEIGFYVSDFSNVKFTNAPELFVKMRGGRKLFGLHDHKKKSTEDKCLACQAEMGLNMFLWLVYECGGTVEEIRFS